MASDPTLDSLPDIIEVVDAAKYLHLSTKTIYKLIHSGRLRSCSTGRKYKIRKSWLIEFVNGAEF